MENVLSCKETGTKVGRFLIGTGVASLAYSVVRHVAPTPLVVGSAAVGAGMWLVNKLYLDDPKAREEYLEKLRQKPLSESLGKDFKTYISGGTALQNILSFASAAEVGLLLHQEVDHCSTVSILVELYGVKIIKELEEKGIVTKHWLRTRSEDECRMSYNESFSGFWIACRGELPALVTLGGIVNVDLLREMFAKEYSWVDVDTGGLVPTAPSADDINSSVDSVEMNPPGGIKGVWPSVASYGKWVRSTLNVSKGALATIIETCPYALDQALALSTCIDDGLMQLYDIGLLSSHWVEQKLRAELRGHSVGLSSLWHFEKSVQLRELLLRRIIHPEVVEQLFHCGVPTHANFTSGFCLGSIFSNGLTPENNIVEYILYWREVFSQSPTLVPRGLRYEMLEAFNAYEREEAKLRREYSAMRNKKDEGSDSDEKKKKKKRHQHHDRPGLEAEITSLKKSIHSRFCENISRSYHSSQWNVHTEMNLSCPTM